MNDLEQSVFSEVQRHPYCSAVLIAFKLGLPQAKVEATIEQLAERGILEGALAS